MDTLNYIINLFWLFLAYSMIGWLIEVTLVSIESKKFVNRGFLIGPYCPIYGCGGVAISLLLKKYSDDIIVTFILSSIIASVLEYITSYLMEKLFKARWWDYSNRSFNINGRVCLLNSIFFGIIGTVMLNFVTPTLQEWIEIIPQTLKYILTCILFLMFVADNIISFNIISSMKNIAFEIKKDNTFEITKKVKEKLLEKSVLFRRLVHAFPNLKYTIQETRNKINERKQEFILKAKKSIETSKEKLQSELEEGKQRFKIKKH